MVALGKLQRNTYWGEEALSHETCSGVQLDDCQSDSSALQVEYAYKELHLRDLLVDFLHELNDKVHQLMLQHLLGVEVCDQERNIIALFSCQSMLPL